jgi:hypothetical protein
MNKTFKSGDKVRALTTWSQWFKKGDILTVSHMTQDGDRTEADGLWVYVSSPNFDHAGGFYPENFELVSSSEFNISTATDQELADEYRRLVNEATAMFLTLRERGYTVKTDTGMIIAPSTRRRIFKKVESTVEL